MKFELTHIRQIFENNDIVFILSNLVIGLCTFTIMFAILIDFVRFHTPREAKRKTHSWVETGTMFLFFVLYYLLMNVKSGKLVFQSGLIRDIFCIAGTLLILGGCIVNVLGRFSLKANWANQVTIYHNHTLVTVGVYRLFRHPLYASIIWMLIGGCFVYLNYLALISVLIGFVPMMRYRARQEERLLESEFPEYKLYKNKVGMFSPKLFKRW